MCVRVFVRPTEILDVLIAGKLDDVGWNVASEPAAGNVALVDDDAVGSSSRNEGEAVRALGDGGVGAEGDAGEQVAEHGEDQRKVPTPSASSSSSSLSLHHRLILLSLSFCLLFSPPFKGSDGGVGRQPSAAHDIPYEPRKSAAVSIDTLYSWSKPQRTAIITRKALLERLSQHLEPLKQRQRRRRGRSHNERFNRRKYRMSKVKQREKTGRTA